MGDPAGQLSDRGHGIDPGTHQGGGIDAGTQSDEVERVEERPEDLARLRAGLDRQPDAAVVGTPAQRREGGGEDTATFHILLRRDRPHAGQDEVRAQLVRHGEGTLGAADPLVELIDRVERPAGGEAQGDERELDGAQQVTQLAPAGLTQAMRGEVADRVEHHAPRAQPRGLVDLLPHRAGGVDPQSQRMAYHRVSVLSSRVVWSSVVTGDSLAKAPGWQTGAAWNEGRQRSAAVLRGTIRG
jgi:hypothetical protein